MKVTEDLSVGIIVFRLANEELFYLIIRHDKGHWSFPKGHIDEGETKIEAAKRELFEETGINEISLMSEEITASDHYYFMSGKEKISKTVEYFIGQTSEVKVTVDNNEIIDYRWGNLKDSLDLLTFNQTKELLIKADSIIKNKISFKL